MEDIRRTDSVVAPHPGVAASAYRVDPEAIQRTHQELRLERERELSRHLLSALLDSLEEPIPDRRSRILRALATVLRSLLHRGEVGLAQQALAELDTIAARDGLLDGSALACSSPRPESPCVSAITRKRSLPGRWMKLRRKFVIRSRVRLS